MILGTGSHVGKTTIVAGLCRLLANLGVNVAPFKSQNMALNAYVTSDRKEIGRATAVQAAAARQVPTAAMNPVLLKPSSDTECQVLIDGTPVCDASARDNYFGSDMLALKSTAIAAALSQLSSSCDMIVAEGAGSCAEPNFLATDVVNFAVARQLNARVFIVGDIDAGGVFGQFLGTWEILKRRSPDDLQFVEGFIINKFRGDISLLSDAVEFHDSVCPVPIVGVVPLLPDINLEEEDRIRLDQCINPEIRIAIPYLPRIANAGDFDTLASEKGVDLHFVRNASELGTPDAVILPGTKNTIQDLAILRDSGFETAIKSLADTTPIFGICGGFEMLGTMLHDPGCVESEHGSVSGFGLLDVEFTFEDRKLVRNAQYDPSPLNPFAGAGPISGYEIHCGQIMSSSAAPLFYCEGQPEGAVAPNREVFGTFIHDLFRNPAFSRCFVDYLRARRGLSPLTGALIDPAALAEASFERLAQVLQESVPVLADHVG